MSTTIDLANYSSEKFSRVGSGKNLLQKSAFHNQSMFESEILPASAKMIDFELFQDVKRTPEGDKS